MAVDFFREAGEREGKITPKTKKKKEEEEKKKKQKEEKKKKQKQLSCLPSIFLLSSTSNLYSTYILS